MIHDMTENRIDSVFAALQREGRKAFIPYITAGDPTCARTVELVCRFAEAGADIVELGVPFSDPLADGKTNQEAAERALKNNVSLADVLQCVRAIRATCAIPIVFFTYVNPVFQYGYERFARDAADAGVDGVLALDMPPEEADELAPHLAAAGVRMIFLVAPTSDEARIQAIAQRASGFIYYVSRTGVTGERTEMEKDIATHIACIRRYSSVPIAVGFGISTPAHVADIAQYADGVIVGSALVRRIGEGGDSNEMVDTVTACVKELSAPLRNVVEEARAQ